MSGKNQGKVREFGGGWSVATLKLSAVLRIYTLIICKKEEGIHFQ